MSVRQALCSFHRQSKRHKVQVYRAIRGYFTHRFIWQCPQQIIRTIKKCEQGGDEEDVDGWTGDYYIATSCGFVKQFSEVLATSRDATLHRFQVLISITMKQSMAGRSLAGEDLKKPSSSLERFLPYECGKTPGRQKNTNFLQPDPCTNIV